MLEGLEVSEVLFSEAFGGSAAARIDPEYFSKLARKALTALEGGKRLGSLVADGYRVVYESTNIIKREDGIAQGLPFFLQSSSITTPFINEETMDCVGMEDWERYEKGRIIPGELLIEVKGKAEKVAIVPEDFPRNTLVTGTCYKMTLADPLDKYLLVSFLTCKYGQALKDRLKTNLLISYVAKGDLYSIPVPVLTQETKLLIATQYQTAERKHQDSRNGYAQAETLLLAALGLTDWQPPAPLTYEQPASAAFASGRLDAEHYQPRYLALLAHLRQHAPRLRRVREFQLYSERGALPVYDDEGKIPVLTSKHVLETGLDYDNFDRTSTLEPSSQAKQYDLLTYMTGSFAKKPGRTAVLLDDIVAQVSGDVNRLRLREENPVYVAVVLNSMIGREQAAAACTGSIQQHLYSEDISSFLIPFVAADTEAAIVSAVKAAHAARRQAKRLLEAAKRAVEIAIEDGEAAALAYLETVAIT